MGNLSGDRKVPLIGVVGRLPNGLNGLYMGFTKYLLSGVIPQWALTVVEWELETLTT